MVFSFCSVFPEAVCSMSVSGTDMLTEHPLLSEPSSVSFYNWMSNAVGNRTGAATQESPINRTMHNSLQTGKIPRTWC